MPSTDDLVAWARNHANLIDADMKMHPPAPGYRAYWEAADAEAESRVRARAITALDFLERYSGADSQWAVRGRARFQDKGFQGETTYARDLGEVLRAWADQVESGIVVIRQAEASGARAIASTDLMEQVRKLAEDEAVHCAAPIVLAGAALEVALRSAVEELHLDLPQKPSIATYTECLRAAGLLTRQDVKDVTAIGGSRNAAAHGQFDELSRERAGLVELQVNMFLRRLEELVAPRGAVPEVAEPG